MDLERNIEQAVQSLTGAPVHLRFERAPEMAWGIELRGNGQKIGWTPGRLSRFPGRETEKGPG